MEEKTIKRKRKLKSFKIKIVTASKAFNVSEGLQLYGIRHSDDDWGKPISVEKFVMVDRYGYIVSQQPLDRIINSGRLVYELNDDEREEIFNREDKGWFDVRELFEQYDGGNDE